MKKISAVIICKDEESNIEDCLKSILWCDEIIIIDSFSKDSTLKIAKIYTDNIFQNEWKGFSNQRKFALTKINYEWIISLDADERCGSELKNEINSVLSKDNIPEKGFLIPRKSFFLGKWVRHCGWYPDHQLRLFRKDSVYIGERLVHEGYEVNGETGKLKNDILHYTVNSISEFMSRINLYSTLSANEKMSDRKIGVAYILIKPFLEFMKKYIFQMGFMDGITGVMVCYFHMMTKTLTYMKIREMQNKINK
ncbi:MAG: glycosyltransferase family 2 protein [Ignavibacteria bacterium]